MEVSIIDQESGLANNFCLEELDGNRVTPLRYHQLGLRPCSGSDQSSQQVVLMSSPLAGRSRAENEAPLSQSVHVFALIRPQTFSFPKKSKCGQSQEPREGHS